MDFLLSLEFQPTQYDCDVWLRLRDVNYDYLCTHINDLQIIAGNVDHWMTKIKGEILGEASVHTRFYLGKNCHCIESEGVWTHDCTKYIKEAIRRVEAVSGTINRCCPLLSVLLMGNKSQAHL